jgi:hypothetical protein
MTERGPCWSETSPKPWTVGASFMNEGVFGLSQVWWSSFERHFKLANEGDD